MVSTFRTCPQAVEPSLLQAGSGGPRENLEHFTGRHRVPVGVTQGVRLGGVLILDRFGIIRYCDRGLALLLGHEARDVINRHVSDLMPPLGTLPSENPDLTNLTQPGPHKVSLVSAWGQVRNLDLWCHDLDDAARGIQVLEMRYRPPESRDDDWSNLLRSIIQSQDAVLITDVEGRIEYVNPVFESMSGYKAIQLLGRQAVLGSRLDGEEIGSPERLARLLLGETQRDVLLGCEVNGERKYMEVDVRPFVSAEGCVSHLVHTVWAGCRSKREMEELAHAATHDALTELPNRRLFMDRFSQALKGGSRHGSGCTLAFLDVDNLKTINDNHGHGVGDVLLKAVATRLRNGIREVDTVARLGGDEFGLVLVGTTDPASAARVFDKILDSLPDPLAVGDRQIRVSLSIGACLCPAGEGDPHTYLNQADAAMYAAKRAGGNRYHFLDQAAPGA